MLFFGNVQQTVLDNASLQNISYYIKASQIQGESIGYIEPATYYKRSQEDIGMIEYYNPINIYYSLGYWPTELYRFGIVYIFKDDSLSPVYNLRGCDFSSMKDNLEGSNYTLSTISSNIIPSDNFSIPNDHYLSNTKGVFKFKDTNLYEKDGKREYIL